MADSGGLEKIHVGDKGMARPSQFPFGEAQWQTLCCEGRGVNDAGPKWHLMSAFTLDFVCQELSPTDVEPHFPHCESRGGVFRGQLTFP